MVSAGGTAAAEALAVALQKCGAKTEQARIANRIDEGDDVRVVGLLACGEIGVAKEEGAGFVL